MNPLETTKQALAILLRGYSGSDWEGLTEPDRLKLVARAKTLITVGYGILQKLGVNEELEPKMVEVYGRFYEDDAKRHCIHNNGGGDYCRPCKAMAVLNGQFGCGCHKCLGKDLSPEELAEAGVSLGHFKLNR